MGECKIADRMVYAMLPARGCDPRSAGHGVAVVGGGAGHDPQLGIGKGHFGSES